MYSKEEVEKMELEDAKYKLTFEKFEESREIQRKRIVTHLLNLGYEFKTARGNKSPSPKAGGMGALNYTSQGKIPSYDLRHVKYIEAYKGNITIFISMQPLEQDSNTYNYHNLIHHIGVRVYNSLESPEDKAYNNYFNMKLSGINTPLSLCKLDMLASFIEEEIKLLK